MSTESRTLLTELQLDNEKGEILAGSYAQVRFDETSREESLTLPANTLLFRAEGAQVGLVTKEGKVELRNISIGRDFGQTYEVLDGVQPSDRVILNPPDAIVAGESVRVLETKTDAASK